MHISHLLVVSTFPTLRSIFSRNSHLTHSWGISYNLSPHQRQMSNQTKSGAYDNLFSTLTISSLVSFISTLSSRCKKRDSIQADILDSTRYVIAYTISIILEEKTVAWSKNYSVAVNEWTWFSFHITHTHLVQSVGKILNFPLQKKKCSNIAFS